MRPAIYGFSIFSFCLAMLTMLDRGMIAGAAITGGLTLAGAFTLLFCGVPGILRGVYGAIFNTQELHMRGLQIRQQQHSADVIALRAGSNLAFKDLTQGNQWQFFGPAARHMQQDETPEEIEDDHQQLTALDVGMEAERAMVVGGTRSGKTYFCKQLAHHRLKRGDLVYALDPKDQDPTDPWPTGTAILGSGDNFDEMAEFFRWLEEEKARRGKNMGAISSEPFILIIMDEINDTLFEMPELRDHYIRVLRKFAQYRIGLFAVGQSDDVASIGLKGLVQLKQCFDARILFERDPFTQERKSYARIPNRAEIELIPYGPVRFSTPGSPRGNRGADRAARHSGTSQHRTEKTPFWTAETAFNGQARRETEPYGEDPESPLWLAYDPDAGEYVHQHRPRQIFESRQDKTIHEMGQAGSSLNQIARALWGGANGRRTKAIRAKLAEFGFDV